MQFLECTSLEEVAYSPGVNVKFKIWLDKRTVLAALTWHLS